jgi:RNA polymerase sigma-70 factor, ECF subfamily
LNFWPLFFVYLYEAVGFAPKRLVNAMSAAAAITVSLNSKTPFRLGMKEMPWRWGVSGSMGTRSVLESEISLIERCLAGEQGGWEELVKTHTKRVYAICYRFTGKNNEAQDLTQDVFLRIFKTLGSFRAGEGSFTVWLTRLTRNLLVDHYRRTKQERVTDAIEEKLPLLEEKTRTDKILADRETSELLQAGLKKLSPELREAVILRDLEEMEYREIAHVLNVPEGTVKSRLNRGRAELAKVLRRQNVPV